MAMADLSKGAITEDEAVGLLIAEPRPVVFVDTCCLGDIFRGILDGKVVDAHRTCLAVQNNIEKPYCHYLFSEQVKEEFFKPGQFIKREIEALLQ